MSWGKSKKTAFILLASASGLGLISFRNFIAVASDAPLLCGACKPGEPCSENCAPNPFNNACSNLGQYIFIGGTGGFNALDDAGKMKDLLKTGHVGLYQHNNAVTLAAQVPGLLTSIDQTWSGTGAGQAELPQVGANYFTLPVSDGYYQKNYIQNGLHPSEANVDTPSDTSLPGQLDSDFKQWQQYVDAARSVGITSVAPIASPNGTNEPKLGDNVFATNPYYALQKMEALYGKAIALDVPPSFFLQGGSGPGYQKFIVQTIQWANSNGLRTTMLLSPYPWPLNTAGQPLTFAQFTANDFSSATQEFVNYLKEHLAVPSEWSVDNYEDTHPNDAPAVLPDNALNTTTSVGLWLANNAPVYKRFESFSGVSSGGVVCPPPVMVPEHP